MNILIACEASGTVRDAFAAKGWDAWSCDLKPTEKPGQHIQGDALKAMRSRRWDMIIAHPECRYLSSSGMHWTRRGLRDPALTEAAFEFAKAFFDADCERVVIENSVGILSSRIRKPEQIIQPYQFGDDASKSTCLWFKGVPKLTIDPALYVQPRIVNGKKRWANQTDSGQNKLPPSAGRSAARAKTYPGIAKQMADQWTTNAILK